MPKPGQILLTEDTLPYGMEYPEIKLAVLTEGQLTTAGTRQAKSRQVRLHQPGKNSVPSRT